MKLKHFKYMRYACLISTLILFQNCNLSSKGELGLKKILFKYKIKFHDSSYTKIINYTSNLTTDKFEVRLFYDSLSIDPLDSDKVNYICKSLDGFKFSIYDSDNNLLVKYNPNTKDKTTKYSFNYNTPFSLWMHNPIRIRKGKRYKIVLIIPSKNNFNEIVANPILVGGVGKDVFL